MEKYRDKRFSMEERTKDLIKRLTREEKIGLLATRQFAVERLGIKEWHVGAEIARGYVSRNPEEPTSVYPQPIGMAGTFDTELMKEIGEAAGEEARILNSSHPNGHLMVWGPTVDMCRNPLWGRNEEGYGEDPYLTGQMSAAYTLGLAHPEGEYLRTIPTLKHFCANNTEEGRGNSSSNTEPRTLHEYYYAAFKPAITEGGARSVMAAYNELSGVPGMVNPDLKRLLKNKWGMLFAVTDGADFSQNVNSHHHSDSHAETIALAIKNGMDVMTDDAELVHASTREALRRGLITEKDIDEAIYGCLLARFKLGEFDDVHPYSDVDKSRIECEEFRALSLRASLEQMTLLKNNGILPITDKGTSIAVIGENGNACLMDWYTGWSSYSKTIFDGIKKHYKKSKYDTGWDYVAIKSALTGKYLGVNEDGTLSACYDKTDKRAAFELADYGKGQITLRSLYNGKFFTEESMKADSDTTYRWFTREILWVKNVGKHIKLGTYFTGTLCVDGNGLLKTARAYGTEDGKLFSIEVISDGAQRAAKLAEKADIAIVCGGNNPMIIARECYDRDTLSLPESQTKLINAVRKANKNTVFAVVSSYPYAINDQQRTLPAIIYTTHAGPELGEAFAQTISGKYNPAGRLSQTWYKSEEELAPITDYDIIENDMTYLYYNGKPLYEFGYGLSYSKFKYSEFTAKQHGGKITASVKVKNTSAVDGDEVVQIYFSPDAPRVKRPIKQLCAFRRVRIKAGETVQVDFEILKKRLEFYDVTREKLTVESGDYTLYVGASSADIRGEVKLYVTGETIPPRNLFKATKSENYDRKANTRMLWSKSEQQHYMSGGVIFFDTADLRGAKAIELYACNSGGAGEMIVSADYKEAAKIRIAPNPVPDKFIKYRAELSAENLTEHSTLSFYIPGQTGLLKFKLIKG
ncbi:MAG: glycoside hydrolase family 3 C-terminal domain-containing protein [Eubacterium sp.]|nr:glycoside hydrolase family 3 C-terminal domain-containing protein [Eubacterium sp.]